MISASELAEYLTRARPWFNEWRSPEDFAREVDSLAVQIPSSQYWPRGDVKWLREAWSLARYCELSKPTHVRLQTPDPPDAYVRSDGQAIPVEITLGLDPERRIGAEYKREDAFCPQYDEDVDRLPTIREILKERMREKAKITYPPGTLLLIDLNMNDRASSHSCTEKMIHEILAQTHSFSAVRVLWRNQIY